MTRWSKRWSSGKSLGYNQQPCKTILGLIWIHASICSN